MNRQDVQDIERSEQQRRPEECESPPELRENGKMMKETENEREEGATLSPPNTWTEEEPTTEKVDSNQEAESRLLFIVHLSMPQGKIIQAQIHNDNIDEETLAPGKLFFPLLEPKGQSLLLSAAAVSSTRQQIFCRLNWLCLPSACELLCEFDSARARLTALTLRPAFGPTLSFHPVSFTTKHTSSCALSHIDKASIPYLGLLPTDLIGKSLLAFVYGPDVHVVIKAHLDLHQSRGTRIVKSVAPLRLVAHNGAILTSQTSWHAYVNPFTNKIELVVARHKILGVPIGDSNVLANAPEGHSVNVLPSVMAKTFEDELRAIMNKPVPSQSCHNLPAAATESSASSATLPFPTVPTLLPRSCPLPAPSLPFMAPSAAALLASTPLDLGSYIDKLVESLVMHGNSSQTSRLPSSLPSALLQPVPPSTTPSEAAATVSNNKNQSELPLSYNQINCLENVHRLLKSQSQTDAPTRIDKTKENRRPPAKVPLTRETLLQHTKKWEEEYRDTWHRRLKRLSEDMCQLPGAPNVKQMRMSCSSTPPHNTSQIATPTHIRRTPASTAPAPAKNYQITVVPLSDDAGEQKGRRHSPPTEKQQQIEREKLAARQSAFTAVPPKCVPLRELPAPIRLSIHDSPSVIQTTTDPLVVPMNLQERTSMLWSQPDSLLAAAAAIQQSSASLGISTQKC